MLYAYESDTKELVGMLAVLRSSQGAASGKWIKIDQMGSTLEPYWRHVAARKGSLEGILGAVEGFGRALGSILGA